MATGLIFDPDISAFAGQRAKSIYTVLSGNNNSGKSAVLKNLKQHLGRTCYLTLPNRFYQVHQIPSQPKDPNELDNLESQFMSSFMQPEFNHEQNFLDLGKTITNLSDKNRAILFDICGELIGAHFSLKRSEPDNEMSMPYVDMDGQTLGLGSTGTRLLMTLVGICLDTRFNTLLIDEPELGLSPRVQEAVSTFLQDEKRRSELFPHLSSIYVATHSHLFLDRLEPKNNFSVSKEANMVSVTQTQTVSELHRLQFNLLGNSLEHMSLPSAILVTEGPSDFQFIKRVIELKFPDKRVTVVSGLGDVKKKVHSVKEMLGGDLQKSPYRDRLFVIVDSVHPANLSSELETLGVNKDNLVIWDKNGIEYLYPESIMGEIFNVSPSVINQELTINEDNVKIRTVSHRKAVLSKMVSEKLTREAPLSDELNDKLLKILEASIE